MGFAEKFILQSPAIKKENMHKLLGVGLMNAEIIDIIPVASARNF